LQMKLTKLHKDKQTKIELRRRLQKLQRLLKQLDNNSNRKLRQMSKGKERRLRRQQLMLKEKD